MTQELGNSLSLSETLSVLAARLWRLVRFDAFAIYLLRNDKLIPEYVTGEDHALFPHWRSLSAKAFRAGWLKIGKPS